MYTGVTWKERPSEPVCFALLSRLLPQTLHAKTTTFKGKIYGARLEFDDESWAKDHHFLSDSLDFFIWRS